MGIIIVHHWAVMRTECVNILKVFAIGHETHKARDTHVILVRGRDLLALFTEPQTLLNHTPVPVGDSSLFVDLDLSLSRPAFPTAVKNICHLDLLNFWILLHGAVSLKIRHMESFKFNLQEKDMSPHHWLQTQTQAGTFSWKCNILFPDFLTLSKLSGPAVHCLRPVLAGRVYSSRMR